MLRLRPPAFLSGRLTSGALALTLWVGCECSEPPQPPEPTSGCVLDDDCEGDKVCQAGECVNDIGGGDEGEGEVPTEGEGEGEAPVLGVLAVLPGDDVEFGAVRLGSAVERVITLKNTGPVALTIIQLVIDDNDAGTFTSEPAGALNQVLEPDAELGVLLRHVPNDGVPDTAELKVLHTGAGSLASVVLHAEFKGVSTLSISAEATVLSPDVLDVDLGDVALGESRSVTLFVRNDGDLDSVLSVESATITPQNGGFALSSPTLPASLSSFDGLCTADVAECPPGTSACTAGVCVNAAGNPIDSVPLTITFAPLTAEAREATLTIRTDVGGVGGVGVDIVLHGRGVAGQLRIDPAAVTFNEVFAGRPARQTITVTNIGGAATTLTSASLVFPGAVFALESSTTFPTSLAPNDSISVDVVFSPQSAGQFNNIITWDVEGAPTDPQTVLSGNARLAPVVGLYDAARAPLDLDVAAVAFGDLFIGRQTARVLRIVNDGPAGSTLSVRRMVLVGDHPERFTFAPTVIDTQLSGGAVNLEPHIDLTVTYLPSELTGFDDQATLVIETDDPARPVIELELSGRAIRPIIVVEPLAVDFGVVLVGTTPSPTRTITLRNDGVGPLVIDQIDPPSLAVFTMTTSTPLPAVLGPLQTMTVTLTYTPAQANVTPVTSVVVHSSDLERGLVTVSVTGSSGGCPPRANGTVRVEGDQCVYTCNANAHACGDACLLSASPDSCGESCTPCELRANTARGCTQATSTCTYSCDSDARDLNGNLGVPQGTSGGSDGCEYTCPVAVRAETCNQIDDDCDGRADDGLPFDSFDSPGGNRNDTCGSAIRIGDAIEGGSTTIAGSLYLFPALSGTDEDWYVVKAKEQSNVCFPGSGESFRTTISLTGIPAGSDYDLEVRDRTCSGAVFKSEAGGNNNEQIGLTFGGTCAGTDNRDFLVRVFRFGGGSCTNYSLKVEHSQQ